MRLHLARRAAALVTWCEVEESKLVLENTGNGALFDPALYATGVNSPRRLLLDLGLNPALKDVTPDLHRYLALLDDADNVIDAETEPVEEPVRRDSRGRPLRGTPEQAEAARHMRETAMKRKLEKEAEQKVALAAALRAARAAKRASQSGGTARAASDMPRSREARQKPPQPAKMAHRAARLPPQPVKRGT